ncbi:MAG: hypothetical protein C4548_06870 [Desulfobacteraceae bacterium]|jgi:hypothetical protein|nr:MAG: hypothetical protein C4548_06870 [Desulfobacteraceae bacterium]
MPVPRENEKKVERAFEVIEKLEKSDNARNVGAESAKKKTADRKDHNKSGLRIHFAMDALVSENDTRQAGEKDLQSGSSKLIDIRFTVPYIWRIPVIGKTALKIVKHLQAEKYPESIRDILGSFRRDKNR